MSQTSKSKEELLQLKKRVQFLEILLSENCNDPKIPYFKFGDNLERGWKEYLEIFGGRYLVEKPEDNRPFIMGYDHGA